MKPKIARVAGSMFCSARASGMSIHSISDDESDEAAEREPGEALEGGRGMAQRLPPALEASLRMMSPWSAPGDGDDEKARGDDVGEEMPALRQAHDAERRAERDRSDDALAALAALPARNAAETR